MRGGSPTIALDATVVYWGSSLEFLRGAQIVEVRLSGGHCLERFTAADLPSENWGREFDILGVFLRAEISPFRVRF